MSNPKSTITQETSEPRGVSLQAVDVLQQTFTTKFRGYDTLDVDSYLEIVAREMERLSGQNMKLLDELRTTRQELLLLRKKEENVNAALITVQKLAGEVQQKAQAESEQLLEETREKAREIVTNAQGHMQTQKEEIPRMRERAEEESRGLVNDARQEADRMRDEMQNEREKLRDDLTILKQEKIRFEASFRALLETHLNLMESNDGDKQSD
jgi:cell division initiation protein